MTGEDPSAARRLARTIVGAGVTLFWILLAALVLESGMPLLDALLVAGLLVIAPTFSLAQVPLVRGLEVDRLPAYWSSILTLWVLGTSCFLVGTRNAGPSAVGLTLLPVSSLAVWSAGLTAGGLGIIVVFRWISGWAGVRETALLRTLLPRTAEERRVFGLLSFAAGSGEELAYRGYLITVLATVLGTGAALACSTVVFGLLHAYQGWLGIVRTALMGGLLAWGFVTSGSLVPAIVAHTAIDLLAGIVLGSWLLSPGGDSGVDSSATSSS